MLKGDKKQPRKPAGLVPTINRDFAAPLGSGSDDSNLTPQQLRDRVFQLTATAQILARDGLLEPAFESLMRAYILDPGSPDVLACEKMVLPAYEQMKQSHPGGGSASPLTDEQRLLVLKAQKEAERRARERQLWEQASATHRSTPPAPPRRNR